MTGDDWKWDDGGEEPTSLEKIENPDVGSSKKVNQKDPDEFPFTDPDDPDNPDDLDDPKDPDDPDDPKEPEYKLGDFGKKLVENQWFEKEPESVDELVDKITELTEARLKEIVEELPVEAKGFWAHLLRGGKVEDYKGISSPEFEITTEAGQEALVRFMLAKEGKDADEQDALILTYKDKNILNQKAKLYDQQNKEAVRLAQEKADKAVSDAIDAKRKSILSAITELETKAKSVENISGTKVSQDEVKELISFGMRPTVKTKDGDLITPFDRYVMEAEKDPEKFLRLMKFVKADCDPAVFKIAGAARSKEPTKTEKKGVVTSGKVQPIGQLLNLLEKKK